MMMDEDTPAIVIDSGSGICKAGFAGDDAPRSLFSSVVSHSRFYHEEISLDNVIGDKAQTLRELLSLTYPIKRGIVTNWDDAEKIWDYCFKDLQVNAIDQPVLMSEPIFNPAASKERMLECMFETFQVPAFFSDSSATLVLYASGRGVGIILDIGEGLTQVVPVYLFQSKSAAIRQEFGGQDVTTYLQKLLYERGYSFTTCAEREYVREIKEEHCYTSLNFDQEVSGFTENTAFTLPDGNKLTIGKEKFQCGECLFQPSLLSPDQNLKGLHHLLQDCLEGCAIDIRKDFYCNIMLSGGASMMRNTKERLQTLLKSVVPSGMVSQVVTRGERQFNVWKGGSFLASLSTFQKAWIRKEMYEEFGPGIIHRKCL